MNFLVFIWKENHVPLNGCCKYNQLKIQNTCNLKISFPRFLSKHHKLSWGYRTTTKAAWLGEYLRKCQQFTSWLPSKGQKNCVPIRQMHRPAYYWSLNLSLLTTKQIFCNPTKDLGVTRILKTHFWKKISVW